jgi:DNA-binding transcriptional regulator LsrR (DeoR family)
LQNVARNEKNFTMGARVLSQRQPIVQMDPEAALAARAAWLHFAGGKTQGEVAGLLGIQSTKAHRLIARARSEGMIRVFVEGPIGGCIEFEEQLKAHFGLGHCEVVPNIDHGPLPLLTLGTAGARFIQTAIARGEHALIGVGHGRTLAAAADLMASVDAGKTKFVSLLGGLTRRFAASPFDVIHRLAERTSADAYVMPVPFFANSARDRAVLESQFGVSDVIDMARQASIYIAGIGEVDRHSFIATAGMVDEDDIEEVRKSGAQGEMLGQFFREDGSHAPNSVSERALAPRLTDLKSRKIVALAGGAAKTQAIRAILKSGLLHGLITDEATAQRLVKTEPGHAPGTKNGKTA